MRAVHPHHQDLEDSHHGVRETQPASHDRSHTREGRWIKHTRWSLLKAPDNQTAGQLATLADVQANNRRLYRAFLLREELRLLYHLPDPALAPALSTPG